MTIKEFYEYCVAHGAENMTMKIQYRDDGGYYSGSDEVEIWEIEIDKEKQEVTV